jgi:hypothetical protein
MPGKLGSEINRIGKAPREECCMNTLATIEAQIRELSPRDFACLREWFYDFAEECWDKQIALDFKAGKLDQLIANARSEFAAGKASEL